MMRRERIPAPVPYSLGQVLAAWAVPYVQAQEAEDPDGRWLEIVVDDDVTPEQITALAALLAGWVPVPSDSERAAALVDLLGQGMAALQTILDTPDIPAGNRTAAQLSNDVRALQAAVKAEARVLRRVLRLLRQDFSGTD